MENDEFLKSTYPQNLIQEVTKNTLFKTINPESINQEDFLFLLDKMLIKEKGVFYLIDRYKNKMSYDEIAEKYNVKKCSLYGEMRSKIRKLANIAEYKRVPSKAEEEMKNVFPENLIRDVCAEKQYVRLKDDIEINKKIIGDVFDYFSGTRAFDILYEKYKNMLSENEIAEKYGIKKTTVCNRLREGKEKIIKYISGNYPILAEKMNYSDNYPDNVIKDIIKSKYYQQYNYTLRQLDSKRVNEKAEELCDKKEYIYFTEKYKNMLSENEIAKKYNITIKTVCEGINKIFYFLAHRLKE